MQSRISGRARRLALAVSVCLVAPFPAVAQDDVYIQQVVSQMTAADETLRQMGYVREGEAAGWVGAGTESGLIWTLTAGDWAAVAVCDDDCTDIDMQVMTTADMTQLGEDVEVDAHPLVRFSLAETTSVGVSVDMLDCAAAQCYLGIRWYRLSPEAASAGGAGDGSAAGGSAAGGSAPDGAAAAAGSGADDDAPAWVASISSQLEEGERLAAENGLSRTDQHVGLLAADATDRFMVTLEPGEYWGFAVCDLDCSDVDVTVTDGAENEVASDVLPDDAPIVEFNVATAQSFHVTVGMVTCSTATCGYGFRLYRRK